MRTNQTIRRFFSILITVSMLLTFLPFARQAVADGGPAAYCIFVNHSNGDVLIQETAADPGEEYSFDAVYIDGTGTTASYDADWLVPDIKLLVNNAHVTNASIYAEFELFGTSRIDYEGGNAYTESDSTYSFEGYFDPDKPVETMNAYKQFFDEHYYQDIGDTIATHITGNQELNEPRDYSYLVIDEGATLTIRLIPREDGPDHLNLTIWNKLTINGNLVYAPSTGKPNSLEIRENATIELGENAQCTFENGTELNLHCRLDLFDLDPDLYTYDAEKDSWVRQEGHREDGIYIGSDPFDLITGIYFEAKDSNETVVGYGADDMGFIARDRYNDADTIEITISSNDQDLFIEIFDASDPEHREPLDPNLYSFDGSLLTISKIEGEGAEWFPVYEIWLKTQGIYFNYDHEHSPIDSIFFEAGYYNDYVSDNFITKSVYEDEDSIALTFDIKDQERGLTIDVHDENDEPIDDRIYSYEAGVLTISKGDGWGNIYNIFIGVDHSQDPREDGIYIGSDPYDLITSATYTVNGSEPITVNDRGFIARDQYDVDGVDSIEITFESNQTLVIEVYDDADPRERLSPTLYQVNDGNKLTIFKGEGESAQWFSSYEVFVKTQGIYFGYEREHPPVTQISYHFDENDAPVEVVNNYIAKSVFDGADSIILKFAIADTERGLTIDIRDENNDRIEEQSGLYTYQEDTLILNKPDGGWGSVYDIQIGVDHSNDPREKGVYIHLDDQNPAISGGVYIIDYTEYDIPNSGFFFIDADSLEGADSIGIRCYAADGSNNIQFAYIFVDENNESLFQTIEDAGQTVYFNIDIDEGWPEYLDIFISEYLGDGMNFDYDPGEVGITFKLFDESEERGLGNNISAEDLRTTDHVDLYFNPNSEFEVIYVDLDGDMYGHYDQAPITHITINRPDSGWGKTINISVTTAPAGQVIPTDGNYCKILIEKSGPGDVRVGPDNLILAQMSTGSEREFYFRPDSQYDIVMEFIPNDVDHAVLRHADINGYTIKADHADQPYSFYLSDFLTNYWEPLKAGDAPAAKAEFYSLDNIAVLEGYKVRLNDSIGVDYYIWMPEEFVNEEQPSVTFTLDSASSDYKTQEATYWDGEWVKEGGKYYFVYSCNITPVDMTKPITATLKGENIEVVFPEFTVRDYIMHFVNDDPNDETSNLAKALLNYGYYAQMKFAPNSQTYPEDALTLPDVQIGAIRSFNVPDGVTYIGSTVVFVAGSSIRHYFQVDPGTTATFMINGTEVDPVVSGNRIYIETDVINILDADEDVRVTITCDNMTYETDFAVLDYIYAVIRDAKQNMSPEMINLAKAFYLYYQTADSYKTT